MKSFQPNLMTLDVNSYNWEIDALSNKVKKLIVD